MGEMRRIGELSRCPACGRGIDPSAYRCPVCRVYFCYKCRARVGKGETRYQCADQSCACYGKLLCSACTVMIRVPETEMVTRRWWMGDDFGDWGEAFLPAAGVSLVSSFVSFWVILLALTAVGIRGDGLLAACLVGALCVGGGVFVYWMVPTTRRVDRSVEQRCCVQCRHAVKNL
jgi:hypothetical protein